MRIARAIVAAAALLLLLLVSQDDPTKPDTATVSLSAAAADTTDSPEWEEWEHEKIQELQRQVQADWKAGHGKNIRSEKETWRVFADWKARHGKRYNSFFEEGRRYAAFKERLRKIDLHAAAFGRHSVFTIDGPFSDQTEEEHRAMTQRFIRRRGE